MSKKVVLDRMEEQLNELLGSKPTPKVFTGYDGRAEFIEKLNRLVDDNHHYLYLIDGVFEGVKSIEKSIHEYEKNIILK